PEQQNPQHNYPNQCCHWKSTGTFISKNFAQEGKFYFTATPTTK
ncbi:18588_t:CDS:1, partial [Gigaspora rosea]